MTTLDFDALYREHSETITSYLRRRGCSWELAQDLTQDTFVRAMRYADRYQNEGKPAAWLVTIAKRLLLDHWKSAAVRMTVLMDPVDSDRPAFGDGEQAGPDVLVVDQAIRDEVEAVFDQVLAELTPQQERVLRLRFHEELIHRDIAAAVGANEGAVKALAGRAVRALARDRRVHALRDRAVSA